MNPHFISKLFTNLFAHVGGQLLQLSCCCTMLQNVLDFCPCQSQGFVKHGDRTCKASDVFSNEFFLFLLLCILCHEQHGTHCKKCAKLQRFLGWIKEAL